VDAVEFARALREAADRMMSGWTAAAGSMRPPVLPDLSGTPATASARQLEAVLDDLAARRAQVRALQAQLAGFDEQLGALEASLRPLLQWTSTWAELERALGGIWSPPRGGEGLRDRGGAGEEG
jgi:outer membrane protein TolC